MLEVGCDALVVALPWSVLPPLAEQMRLGELLLSRKTELHLTALSRAEHAALLAAGATTDALVALRDALSWSVQARPITHRLHDPARAPERHALIVEVECTALDAFRTQLAAQWLVPLPRPLAHITSFVAGSPNGIGIASLGDFERLRVQSFGSILGASASAA